MAEYIEREAFLAEQRHLYCENCARRKGMKNGKMRFVYEIGDAPCRSCGIGDVLDAVEDFPSADAIESTRKAYQMMAEAYEAEVTKSRWIPVTERLPEKGLEVLVFAEGKIDGFFGDTAIAISKRCDFKIFTDSEGVEVWQSPWQYFMTDYEITHWMQLPEPPKEET